MHYIVSFLLIIALMCTSCFKDPYAIAPNYSRDDVFCWHKDHDKKWRIIGLGEACPKNASFGERR